jgi:hypothetical protein
VPTVKRERLPFFGIHVVLRNGQHLVQRQAGLGDHQRGHQLGDRGDRQHSFRVLAEQHLLGVLVDDQRHTGLQVERVVGGMQPVELAQGRPFWSSLDHRTRRAFHRALVAGARHLRALARGLGSLGAARGILFLGRIGHRDMRQSQRDAKRQHQVPKPSQIEPTHHDDSFSLRHQCMGSKKNVQDQKLADIS